MGTKTNQERTEFPNLAVVAVLLRDFCRPWMRELEMYDSPEEKLEAVRNEARDCGNDEIEAICDYIERKSLTRTFFPE